MLTQALYIITYMYVTNNNNSIYIPTSGSAGLVAGMMSGLTLAAATLTMLLFI